MPESPRVSSWQGRQACKKATIHKPPLQIIARSKQARKKANTQEGKHPTKLVALFTAFTPSTGTGVHYSSLDAVILENFAVRPKIMKPMPKNRTAMAPRRLGWPMGSFSTFPSKHW